MREGAIRNRLGRIYKKGPGCRPLCQHTNFYTSQLLNSLQPLNLSTSQPLNLYLPFKTASNNLYIRLYSSVQLLVLQTHGLPWGSWPVPSYPCPVRLAAVPV